ncbi:uncharacterized protein EAF02_003864 [Botrytis sinoallii]|uniref:uncharacterized protein n=1 Tax=Botrytis sinoallii TaxID=1463999 RepID=UPI0018FF1433|nr:uncharacterized protein EAF02_003864 [Botrytis sinoallii]KAF7887217.1 hypothetical protein EAF02_003864 [Botrytis sinoallii]
MSSPKHLRIGVFIPAGCQLLDMSGIDIFSVLSPEYLSACGLPAPLVALGISCTIYYISLPSTGPEVELTANAFLRLSKTTKTNEVQPVAQCGILKGLSASGPRALIPRLKKEFSDTKWVDDRRWVVDGNIWSSGGITNGLEMIAAYIRQKFPSPAAEAVIAMADVGEKGVFYTNGNTNETLRWLWQILRAVGLGIGKDKKSR